MMTGPVVRVLMFGAGYLALQELGLRLAFPPVDVAAFWPAAGFAIGFFAWSERRLWPPLIVGLVLVNVAGNVAHGSAVALSAGFAVANAAEALVGARLLQRLGGPAWSTGVAHWILPALVPVTVASCAVGATIGTASLLVNGVPVPPALTWWHWFTADALGVLAVLPGVAALHAARLTSVRALRSTLGRRAPRVVEAVALLSVEAALAFAIFGRQTDHGTSTWAFVLLPAVLWSVVRFSPQFTAILTMGVTFGVIAGTAGGNGPFALIGDIETRLLAAQGLAAVLVLSGLLTAGAVARRDQAEVESRTWAKVLANAVEGISYISLDGTYASMNPAYASVLGVEPDTMIGRPWAPTVHPDDLSRVTGAYERMLQDGKGSAEARGIRADGSVFHKEVTLVIDRDEDGRHVGHFCFMRDVTDRVAATEHVTQMFGVSPDLMAVIDGDARLVAVNPAWTAVLGYPESELVGRTLAELIHDDDLDATIDTLADVYAGAMVSAFENRCRCADGSWRWLSWHATWDAERAVGYATARDVTVDKRLTQQLADARDQAMEASRVKSQFVATMSHEIRTPMSGVIGLSNLLDDTTLNGEQQRYVDGIRTAGEALMAVINDVLDFSKLEAGKLVLDEVEFDITELIDQVRAISEQSATERGLALRIEVDGDVPRQVRGDPTRIRQILLNLVGNALKFTSEGGVDIGLRPATDDECTSITAAAGRQVVCIEVADSGMGMTDEVLARVFRPFTQADASTTRNFGGTGLGLAISRDLVQAMGGALTAASISGEGSTFRVVLPLEPGRQTGQQPVLDRSVLQVLIVDDTAANLELLAAQLAQWGMRAHTAERPEAALAMLREGGTQPLFDAAVVDMHMPGMTGLDLADAMVADPAIPDVPVILMTSGEAISTARARRARISARITKPVSESLLMDALVAATAQSSGDTVADAPGAAGRGRVLLVEDNEMNQMVASVVLAKLGFTVNVAGDGIEALRLAADGDYHAILMDCQMPNMDGYTATRQLRRRTATAETPIIALTANAFEDDRIRCIDAGMDDFLTKPIRADELEATLTRWIGAADDPAAVLARADSS